MNNDKKKINLDQDFQIWLSFVFPNSLARLHKVPQQSNTWIKREEVKVSGKTKQWPHDNGIQTNGKQDLMDGFSWCPFESSNSHPNGWKLFLKIKYMPLLFKSYLDYVCKSRWSIETLTDYIFLPYIRALLHLLSVHQLWIQRKGSHPNVWKANLLSSTCEEFPHVDLYPFRKRVKQRGKQLPPHVSVERYYSNLPYLRMNSGDNLLS